MRLRLTLLAVVAAMVAGQARAADGGPAIAAPGETPAQAAAAARLHAGVRSAKRAPTAGPTTRVRRARRAAAAAAPTLTIPLVPNQDTCETCLQSDTIAFLQSNGAAQVPVTVMATPAAGQTISSIVLQYAPSGTSNWSPLYNVAFSASAPYKANLGYGDFPGFPGLDGTFDVRVVVTDSGGATAYSAPVQDVVIASDLNSTYVGMADPGAAIRGAVNLIAAPETAGAGVVPDTVRFQISPAGAGQWSTIARGPVPMATDSAGNPIIGSQGGPQFIVGLDTTTQADGQYDIRVLASDQARDTFVGNITRVIIDNTPPTITLSSPGSGISGVVKLAATAADAGSGIASVRFESAPAGSNAWSSIGLVSSGPYTRDFDTRGLQSGIYDLRAVATDVAGNTTNSDVPGVSISNSAPLTAGVFSVTNSVVPATGPNPGSAISLLGEVASSPDHETWAYGYTSALSAIVDGSPLPYTAPAGSKQLVLLRYTDQSGWEIADVVRKPDGSGFPMTGGGLVTGAMTADGEAWILINQGGAVSVFHRAPGGAFVLDPSATAALAPLAANETAGKQVELRLGMTAGGVAYGLLVNPTSLAYGVLSNGAWQRATASLPPGYGPGNGGGAVVSASPTGPGSGWALIDPGSTGTTSQPLILGRFDPSGWHFPGQVGLDALDVTGAFAVGITRQVHPDAILAASDGIWLQADVTGFSTVSTVVALFDPASGRVVASWCAAAVMAVSRGCAQALDANHPATVPDAVFDTAQGPVGLSLGIGFVNVYAAGVWRSVAAPGFSRSGPGTQLFEGPTDGWLAGADSMGRITAAGAAGTLVEWPEANQSTLVSVAIPAAGSGIGTSGALAVGLHGTALHFDSTAGWVVDPVPPLAQSVDLLGVAYAGPSKAVAVGGLGTILDWNGTSWSADPQSVALTQDQLNAVAFAPDGEGWAVGTFGTILHFDGTAWAPEAIDPADVGVNVTSVTVAGGDVFAVAGGNLITRTKTGTWQRVDSSSLPAGLRSGSLTLVAGLRDGGLVSAGKSVVLVRQNAGAPFQLSAQPIDGIAVALAPYRDQSTGLVRTFVSVAPPAIVAGRGSDGLGGFPAGDGELLRQTPHGWQDLSAAQYPLSGSPGSVPGDGAPEPDPVLAVAADPGGDAGWAVGGYAGTQTASGLGSTLPLQARPLAWQTSSIWRYDAGGTVAPPALTQATVSLPAQPNTVSFAFFSGAQCVVECSQVRAAQPDVNLSAAAGEIASFAAQPGGPAFAVLGGNAVGPTSQSAWTAGNGAVDLENLPGVLAPLGGVPLYAAYGPLDAVPTSRDPAQPWNDAFAQSPAPFGQGATPPGITAVGSGGRDGSVNHYYAYDVTQNGGTLRVVVLDDSGTSLEASASGQSAWLDGQLSAANAAGVPVVVFVSKSLDSTVVGAADDADQVATKLVAAGVLAVFTTSPTQSDTQHMVPFQLPGSQSTAPQIPEYEGAALGYQQSQNNGVLWYLASADTAARTVSVQGIPVVSSLALEPLAGLHVARSSTLSFRAVGRRPAGTLPAAADSPTVQGYANYVAIPSSSCGSCVRPSYAFTSSNPAIGNFVVPSGPGSQFPKLNGSGKPIASATSGLFCAFNAGQTTVSITSGLLTSSLTVTVKDGPIGQPCGTVTYIPGQKVVTVPSKPVVQTSSAASGAPSGPPPAPASQSHVTAPIPKISVPPPPAPAPAQVAPAPKQPAPKPTPVPPPPAPAFTPVLAAPPAALIPPVVVPPIPPPATPIPPGGATAQAAAKREEKARKQASQSAYATRPAGSSAEAWFYPAAGVVSVLTVLLLAEGMRPGPKPRPVLLELRESYDPRSQRRRRM